MTPKLIPTVLRCTPKIGFIPAGVLAVVMGLVAGRQPLSPEYRFLPTRLAVLAIVIAAGFVFDDPATATTDSVPSPLRFRRGIRALFGLLMAAGLFAVVIPFASDDMNLVAVSSEAVSPVDAEEVGLLQPEFPWGRLGLEMATMIGFTLAIAAVTSRRGESEPGRIATGVMLGVYAASWMIPEMYRPWASPMDQRWDTGAIWWWVALSVVWGLTAFLSWDSRTGRLLRRKQRSVGDSNLWRVGSEQG